MTMKKIVFALPTLLLMWACSSSVDEFVEKEDNNALRVSQASSSTSWEDCEKCALNNNAKEVYAPWASGTVSTVPQSVLKDVSSKDGWNILYSTVSIVGCNVDYNYTPMTENANYILLYNKFSGKLKGFCYLEEASPNNKGLWHLTIPQSTSLFNFTGEYATPLNGEKIKDVYLSNITEEGLTGGFTKGWNCFELELAYDPNSTNETLNISGVTVNETFYSLIATSVYETKGDIRLAVSDNGSGLLKGVASAGGSAVKDLINKTDFAKYSSVQGAVANLAAKGVTALLSSGLNKLFPSLSGSTKYENYDVTLTTQGETQISGNSISPKSGIIIPISGIKLNSLGYALGVWNIKTSPSYIYDNPSLLKKGGYESSSNQTLLYYGINVKKSYDIVFNPILQSTSSSLDVVVSQLKADGLHIISKDGYTSYDFGKMTLPAYIQVMSPDYLPNKTLDVYDSSSKTYIATPAIDWSLYTSVDLEQNADGCIRTTISNNGIKYESSKIFKPTKAFNSLGARPYQWTLSELKLKGFIN